MNEYEPWKELGIDELQYFKNKYIEARKENEQLQKRFEEAVEVLHEISPNCNFLRSLDKG